ncbi:MAG: ATP-binding protein [Anaeromyxobacteraceae bacterium]|nr:ATP-binding protein [Anaeromyxobacteraceae bacterium]
MAFWRFLRRGADPATEKRLRALVGQAPSIFFSLDRQGRVLMAEGRLLRALGRRARTDLGASVFELFKDVPWALEGVRLALGGRTVTVRGEADGRSYEVRFAPVRGGDGEIEEVVGLASDATELREAEGRLRRQASRLAALAEASRAFAGGLDYTATLETVARRLSELIGDGALIRMVSEDGEWLIPVAVYHPDPERAALRRKVLQASPQRVGEGLTGQVLRAGRVLRVARLTPEVIHTQMKPEYWPYLEGASSLLIAPLVHRRQIMGHITLLRDTARPPYTEEDESLLEDLAHRAAQAIENARLYGQAQAAVAARDEFLSIASHELRTPLTALRLALENLRRVTVREVQTGPSPQLERVLAASERAGQRLEKLVEALLDVSRIHMGRLELDVEPLDLGTVVAEAVATLDDELRQSGSSVEVRGEPTSGHWDRLRLGQVLLNLLSNAVKYGAGKPIEVGYGTRDARAFITIRDHGIGIDPADQRHIFERFERAVSSQNYGGLGLGLYIVKRIMEAHGGVVRVESRPGEGAAFEVELPLRPAVPLRPPAPPWRP